MERTRLAETAGTAPSATDGDAAGFLPPSDPTHAALAQQVSVLADLEARIDSLGGSLTWQGSSVSSPRVLTRPTPSSSRPAGSSPPGSPDRSPPAPSQISTDVRGSTTSAAFGDRDESSRVGAGDWRPESREILIGRETGLRQVAASRLEYGEYPVPSSPRASSREGSRRDSFASWGPDASGSVASALGREVEALLRAGPAFETGATGGFPPHGSGRCVVVDGTDALDGVGLVDDTRHGCALGVGSAADSEEWATLESMAERLGVLADSPRSTLGKVSVRSSSSNSSRELDSVSSSGPGDVELLVRGLAVSSGHGSVEA